MNIQTRKLYMYYTSITTIDSKGDSFQGTSEMETISL